MRKAGRQPRTWAQIKSVTGAKSRKEPTLQCYSSLRRRLIRDTTGSGRGSRLGRPAKIVTYDCGSRRPPFNACAARLFALGLAHQSRETGDVQDPEIGTVTTEQSDRRQ